MFKSILGKIGNAFKSAWNWFMNIPWTKTVSPVIAYSVFGGAVVLAVGIGLIVCLTI